MKSIKSLYVCLPFTDMCPKPNNTKSALSKQSHVEDLPDPIPTLFQTLVSEPDSLDRWFTLTFPVDFKNIEAKKEIIETKKDTRMLCVDITNNIMY